MKPLEIIGGGLSGLALGIALRRREVPVTIHEAATYPRHRVCGEFISGTALDTMEQLGIADILMQQKQHTKTAWYGGDQLLKCFDLPHPAIAVSRYRLDEWLAQRFLDEGGELVTQSRRDSSSISSGTLWCAGRIPVKGKGEWLGCKIHVRDIEMKADLEMHLGKGGYAGLTSIEEGWINLCALFRINPAIRATREELMPRYLESVGLQTLADKVRQATWRPGSIVGISGFALGHQNTGAHTLGDANSIIPPFTGNGMSMALQSAEAAVPFLLAYSRDETDWDTTLKGIQRSLAKRFQSRMRWAGLMHRFLLSTACQKPLFHLASSGMVPMKTIFYLTRH